MLINLVNLLSNMKTRSKIPQQNSTLLSLIIVSVLLSFPVTRSDDSSNGEYLIGVGSFDMTGPAAGVNMMGYANMDQNTAGVHFRLRARTFIVAESSQGPRFAFVNLDAGMASQLVNIKVLDKLKSRYIITRYFFLFNKDDILN